jgi:hypothetical protein
VRRALWLLNLSLRHVGMIQLAAAVPSANPQRHEFAHRTTATPLRPTTV